MVFSKLTKHAAEDGRALSIRPHDFSRGEY